MHTKQTHHTHTLLREQVCGRSDWCGCRLFSASHRLTYKSQFRVYTRTWALCLYIYRSTRAFRDRLPTARFTHPPSVRAVPIQSLFCRRIRTIVVFPRLSSYTRFACAVSYTECVSVCLYRRGALNIYNFSTSRFPNTTTNKQNAIPSTRQVYIVNEKTKYYELRIKCKYKSIPRKKCRSLGETNTFIYKRKQHKYPMQTNPSIRKCVAINAFS